VLRQRIFVKAVRGESSLYVDEGVADVFPAQPLLDKDSYEVMIVGEVAK
jgi:hypothetical protein